MKEMIYKNLTQIDKDGGKEPEILHSGTYKGYNFVIISYGSHPCAYINIPEENSLYGKDYSDDYKCYDFLNCHGGVTFSSFGLTVFNFNKGFWIGWDYAHCEDYYGYMLNIDMHFDNYKQWTTKEIFEEVKDAIRQIITHEKDLKNGK